MCKELKITHNHVTYYFSRKSLESSEKVRNFAHEKGE